MNKDELIATLGLDSEARYDLFLTLVAKQREMWILVNADNHFLKIASDDEGVECLPVWPSQVFAQDYAKDSTDLSPLSVPLSDFFKKWVPGLSKDGLEVGVFPGLDNTLWITEPEELKQDLQDVEADF